MKHEHECELCPDLRKWIIKLIEEKRRLHERVINIELEKPRVCTCGREIRTLPDGSETCQPKN